MNQTLNFEILKQHESLILELGFAQENLEKLKKYIELLWKSNEELNLISRKMSFQDLIENHIIDCLLPLKYLPQDMSQAADFGSGGGLPSVIYAIQLNNCQYSAYEKSPLKQKYLNECSKIAPNLAVKGEITQQFGGVDLVTARAFKPIDVILDMSRNYYSQKGRYFLLKGRREKIDEELLLAQKKFKDLKPEIIKLSSPLLEVERHLVLINF